MLPTIPRCVSRSMNSSETRPSSRRATRVSWGVVLTIKSLAMEGPFHEPSFGGPVRSGCGHTTGWRPAERRGAYGLARRAVRPGKNRLDVLGTAAPGAWKRPVGTGPEVSVLKVEGQDRFGRRAAEDTGDRSLVGEAPHADVE